MVYLRERKETFEAETGIPMSYLVILFENDFGNPTDAADAVEYIEDTGIEDDGIAVFANPAQDIIEKMPFTGRLPAKCVVSPKMRILECYSDSVDDRGFEAIVENWENSQ